MLLKKQKLKYSDKLIQNYLLSDSIVSLNGDIVITGDGLITFEITKFKSFTIVWTVNKPVIVIKLPEIVNVGTNASPAFNCAFI